MTGVVIKEKVKCGKPGCRCARGKLHGWYYYVYYREWDGARWRLRKEYVQRSKAKILRRKIRRWKRRDLEKRRYDELLLKFLMNAISGAKGNYGSYNKWIRHREDFLWMLERGVRKGDFDREMYESFRNLGLTGEQ
jgi:hypothetical protein